MNLANAQERIDLIRATRQSVEATMKLIAEVHESTDAHRRQSKQIREEIAGAWAILQKLKPS